LRTTTVGAGLLHETQLPMRAISARAATRLHAGDQGPLAATLGSSTV